MPAAVGDPLVALLGDLLATEHLQESQEFARLVQHGIATQADRSRGVKQAPFVVLLGVQMPAALVEIGFVTNPSEEKRLTSDGERDRLTREIAEAVTAFRDRYDARRGLVRQGGDSEAH
jgi:N-acetylmuramoyl-L-alanine amidase